METSARLSSKGQITVPRAVRRALDLREGDRVVFRVEGGRAVLAKTQDFLELAGSVPVPVAARGLPWSAVIARARAAWASETGDGPGDIPEADAPAR